MALKEPNIIEGIEVFSDASIHIYKYQRGFDTPIPFVRAIKDIHVKATDSIAEHFTSKQLKAWQSGTIESFKALIYKCHALYLIFDNQEEIIGYMLLWEAGLLKHLYILPEHQFKGVGSKLLKMIEKDPANRDEKGILTLKGNKGSYQFYLKNGYHITSEETLVMAGVDIPVKIMEKSFIK